MPVTATMSRKLTERLGEDVADELVNWLNDVDSRHTLQLRELADMYFARFDAKLEQRLAELRTEIAVTRADLIKWMFIFCAGSVVTVVGLLKALLR